MEIAVAIMFVLGSAWLVQWLVEHFGGDEHDPVKFWDALTVLICGRLAVRGLTWLWPDLDMPLRVSLSVGVYVATVTLLLVCYQIRPLRAVLISIVIAVLMSLRGILLVLTS